MNNSNTVFYLFIEAIPLTQTLLLRNLYGQGPFASLNQAYELVQRIVLKTEKIQFITK